MVNSCCIDLSNLFPDNILHIFYWIKVRTLSRSVYNFDVLFCKLFFHVLSCTSWGIIMHEYRRLNRRFSNWRNDLLLKKVTVHIGIYCSFNSNYRPNSLRRKHPHIITDPPPNFIDFLTHFGLSLSPARRRTYCRPSDPTNLNLYPLKCTLPQAEWVAS